MKKIHAPCKPIRLTRKEIVRADGNITMVVRPQAAGGFMVGAFRLDGTAVFPRVWVAEDKEEIPVAIKDENRWLSKLGYGLGSGWMMWDASRSRFARKRAEGAEDKKIGERR